MTGADDRPLVGCLGGGQLARMLALAGHRLGVRVRVLDPHPDACAREVCEHVCAAYDDERAHERFLDGLDALTFEFESVPSEVAEALGKRVPLRPSVASLRVCKDRVLEKQAMEHAGLDVHPWAIVENQTQLGAALGRVGTPAMLKRSTGGYDGKGQRMIREDDDALGAWRELDCAPCIAEAFVPFVREVSLVGARTLTGDVAFWPIVENVHEEGILRATLAPAINLDERLAEHAHEHAAALMEGLDHVGVFAIEFFEADGMLFANETAPRVHNTGHWTIEGAFTSQFEQHLRCVLGLPLGFTEAHAPCAMVNLIGEHPDLRRLAGLHAVSLHLYGKAPRPGRKIGHMTTLQPTLADRDEVLARMKIAAGMGTRA